MILRSTQRLSFHPLGGYQLTLENSQWNEVYVYLRLVILNPGSYCLSIQPLKILLQCAMGMWFGYWTLVVLCSLFFVIGAIFVDYWTYADLSWCWLRWFYLPGAPLTLNSIFFSVNTHYGRWYVQWWRWRRSALTWLIAVVRLLRTHDLDIKQDPPVQHEHKNTSCSDVTKLN